ncbi:MAG: methylated-DNA--[protein]-cysteine S-methyltransferase [Cyanobacteriota bacterium]
MNFYYKRFDTPFGESIIASVEGKVCWLSFKDDGSMFKEFIEDYICVVVSAKMKRNFNLFKERYAPIARKIVSKNYKVIEANNDLDHSLELIQKYFKGNKVNFNEIETVYLEGTPFQRKVWDALKTIEYGKYKSYKEIAKRVEAPGAYRAVGSANGKNYIPLIIPCHRVINADGSLGGYSGGLDIKKKLLEIEEIKIN